MATMKKSPNKMTYGNFQDPIGLVLRMLKSGKKAAYTSLVREFMALMMLPIDRLLKHQEITLLHRTPNDHPLPVILVVGPPRSGSTLIYQALASSLPVSYLTNFGALFSDSPIVASKWFDRFLSHSPPTLKSYFGNTEKLSDPNDGFNIWDRWLGKDRYCPNRTFTPLQQEEMNRFFNTWTATFKRPLINKNNRNTTCMDVLAASLDNVYFIVVNRDPVFVAQSLLLAREEIQGSRDIGWGLGSNLISDRYESNSGLHQVAEQVAWIYSTLDQQMQKIPSDRLIKVKYETFCQDPNSVISDIYAHIWHTIPGSFNLPQQLNSFKISQNIRLSPDEFQQLQNLVQHYFKMYAKESTLVD